jgi:hypothetical protein
VGAWFVNVSYSQPIQKADRFWSRKPPPQDCLQIDYPLLYLRSCRDQPVSRRCGSARWFWPIIGGKSYVRETGKSMKAGELAVSRKDDC